MRAEEGGVGKRHVEGLRSLLYVCYVSLWRDESEEDMLSATVQKDSRVVQCRRSMGRQKEEPGDEAVLQPRGQRLKGVRSKTNTGGRVHRIAPKTRVLGCILRTHNLLLLLFLLLQNGL